MAVTMKDVEHVAVLARLTFTESEKEHLVHHLNAILGYMETLSKVDTSGVEPLSHVIGLQNVFREDVSRPSTGREELLKSAPDRTEEYFKVPKVLGRKE